MIRAMPLERIRTMQKHIVRTIGLVAALTSMRPFEAPASRDLTQGTHDAAARAASILAGARQALGGDEKLRSVKTLQASGDVRRSMGDMQLEGELELFLEAPDKLRRNESIGMPGGGTMVRTEVLNGLEVWDDSSQRGGMGGHVMIMRGPGGREMSEDQMKEMRRRTRRADLARYMLAWLLTTDATVTHAGVAEAQDGKADVLEVTPAEGPAMRLFVDQKTRMPLMVTWQGPQPRIMVRRPGGSPPSPDDVTPGPEGTPPQATFELRFEDYREVDGVLLPHHISRGVNGSVNEEWTVKSYKVNATFKNGTFTK
jgi:hypothetical protein